MALNFATIDDSTTASVSTQNALELLSKNTLTTVGVVIGSGTAVAAGALVTAALPAQMLTAAALSAGCIYAGDRQSKGLSVNPFASKSMIMAPTQDHTAGVDINSPEVTV